MIKLGARNPLGTLAHELKHAFQYENKEVDQNYNGGGGANLIDLHDELEAFKRGQLIDKSYYEGINFTIDLLRSYYPNDPAGPINASSLFTSGETYEQAINRDLFERGASDLKPNIIIKGWQVPYIMGVVSTTLN